MGLLLGARSLMLHEVVFMTTIKVISHALTGFGESKGEDILRHGCLFKNDAHCRDYDWAVVYDDFPKADVGSICRECEPLACPPEQTILVTAEPPSIKIYPRAYTRQFGYVLTTHAPRFLPHPNHRVGRGCLYWMAGYPLDEVFAMPDYPKSRLLSTVCSTKQQKHTQHYLRYRMVDYLSKHLDDLDWYGWGVKNLDLKYEALSPYRYHIAAENYIAENHWTDKISDPILGLCLTFYAGDPALGCLLPPESFIPIPIDDPPRALRIIREAIANNEYEKRLPAIREARRLVVERYNFYAEIASLIREHEQRGSSVPPPRLRGGMLRGRHALRRNPLHALGEGYELCRYRLLSRATPLPPSFPS